MSLPPIKLVKAGRRMTSFADETQSVRVIKFDGDDDNFGEWADVFMALAAVKGYDAVLDETMTCLLYTSPSPRDISGSRMPSSA